MRACRCSLSWRVLFPGAGCAESWLVIPATASSVLSRELSNSAAQPRENLSHPEYSRSDREQHSLRGMTIHHDHWCAHVWLTDATVR